MFLLVDIDFSLPSIFPYDLSLSHSSYRQFYPLPSEGANSLITKEDSLIQLYDLMGLHMPRQRV